MASISEFIAEVYKRGVSRPNFFEVIVIPPGGAQGNARLLTFFCRATSIPNLALLTSSITENYIPFEAPYGAQFSGISLDFYLDSSLVVRKLFETWQNAVYNHQSRTVNYFEQYAGRIIISAQDKNYQPVFSLQLEGVFPTEIAPVAYDRSANDQVATQLVNFAFKEYSSESSDTPNSLNPLTQSLMGGMVSGNLATTINTLVGSQSAVTKDVFSSLQDIGRTYVSLTGGMNALSPADQASIRTSDFGGILADTRSQINPWSNLKIASYSATKVS